MANDEELLRLKDLKLLILDVDGILTDGQTWQDYHGSWRRYFSVRDSMGLRALKKAGVRVAVITSATGNDVRDHLTFIGIEDYVSACDDKAPLIGQLLEKYGFKPDQAALMSEEPLDLEIMKGLGFGFTVPSANESMREAASLVTSKSGGDGAVLEVCGLILQCHGFHRAGKGVRQAIV
jgi:3-deoxy-D-manno-octulosonate 8-phosphate phosphatase (KDO 8-P phosphatase)